LTFSFCCFLSSCVHYFLLLSCFLSLRLIPSQPSISSFRLCHIIAFTRLSFTQLDPGSNVYQFGSSEVITDFSGGAYDGYQTGAIALSTVDPTNFAAVLSLHYTNNSGRTWQNRTIYNALSFPNQFTSVSISAVANNTFFVSAVRASV